MGSHPGGLGGTFGGNPIACAAALATIETIERDGYIQRARDMERLITEPLLRMQADDDRIGDAADLPIGAGRVVPALDAGLRGMRVGGRRRINVRPERGWKLPDAQCLTTITDMAIVPTSKVQENDACFDGQSMPTPANFASRRRMLRRYDETLIVDAELVDVLAETEPF